ncbi:hypothetical protein OS493_027124 [Desmophyllum pertusum]|uniref:Uncharacterized protein n=1 Tax=Desmophyllum pertusum TaxID=174260 RepID=A0A9W9ZZL0_9CNID|nr:hypothetical protein OS493_027124 [Desmophyllum pertusum]
MLIDTYEAGTKKDQFKDPHIRIHTIFDYKSTYGVVLAGNSTKLLQCSKSYMQANRNEMFEHISKFIHSIMEDNVSESVEVASGLFDPNNDVFRYYMCITGAMLVVAIVLGLIWECRRKVRTRPEAAQGEGHQDRLKSKELLQEMKAFVGEFYCTFKANYSRLAQKHRSQLRSLKTQRAVRESGTSNWANFRLWPKNKVFY